MDNLNLNWDDIKRQMEESVELEEGNRVVKIKFKGDVQQNQMIEKMVSSEQGLQQTLNQFVGKGDPVDCNINFIESENAVVIENLKDEEITHKVYEFFKDMFFGDFLKNLIEQMFNAFKNLGDLGDLMK
ncbi:MAG: hypothetical protein ACTSO9_07930 [Candidatus Helarchaeota archaeon]